RATRQRRRSDGRQHAAPVRVRRSPFRTAGRFRRGGEEWGPMRADEPIYLDYNATTPVAPEVIEATERALREAWGNPSSGDAFGRKAKTVLEEARQEVAALLGAAPDEI